MATFRKRGPYQWQAQVRKKGHCSQTKTFETRAAAEQWAREVEYEMDRGIFVSRADPSGVAGHKAPGVTLALDASAS